MSPSIKCPKCNESAQFSRRRNHYYCDECEVEFDAPLLEVAPQKVFLSYAHRSEHPADLDISEELVLLIQEDLEKSGHTVWIDKTGIRAGNQWRESITSAIMEHPHFLSFLSFRSVRDPGVCLNEIAIALNSSRHIQTVLVEDERQVAPPLTISHIQWHDFQDWREIRAGNKLGPMGEDWPTWFAQRMESLREILNSAQNARVGGELQRLRDILDPRSFESRIIEKTTGFQGRRWLFDAAEEWLNNSPSRILWVKGSPGVGKSAFAARLAHQARSAVVGFFMCEFQGRKDSEESAREAICTLAFQIASRLSDYRIKLLYEMQVDRDKINRRGSDDLFEFLITEPLNRSGKIPESTRLCLVIDGLDEAGRSRDGNALAQLLSKHAERLPEWMGVLVTSRPEPYLDQILKPLSCISIESKGAKNREDIIEWIDQRLPDNLKGNRRQSVIEAVLEKCGGTFLYLNLVDKDKSLNIAEPESLPDKLDGFFTQTFIRYFPSYEQYGNKTEPFLRLLAASPGPFPTEMGRQILGWSQRELTMNVIEPMGTLLQERGGRLSFFHAAVVEWLKEPRRSGVYCVSEQGVEALANFIWNEFVTFNQSRWQDETLSWLAFIVRNTERWSDIEALETAAIFLLEKDKFFDAITLRRRAVEVSIKKNGEFTLQTANLLHRLGETYFHFGCNSEAYAVFRKVLLIRRSILGGRHPDVIEALQDAAVTRGDSSGKLANYIYHSVFHERLRHFGENHYKTAESMHSVGGIYFDQEDYETALSYMERALAASQHCVPLNYRDVLKYSCDVAACLDFLGRKDVARERLESAVSIAKMNFGISHSEVIDPLIYLGVCLWHNDESDAAIAPLEEALGIVTDIYGEFHIKAVVCLSALARAYLQSGKCDYALSLYRRALVVSEKAKGPQHLDVVESLCNIAELLEDKGDYSEAEPFSRRALAITEMALGPKHPDTLTRLNNLARLLEVKGDYAAAELLYRRALAITEKEQGPVHPSTRASLNNLGLLLHAIGDYESAEPLLRRVLEIAEKVFGEMDPRTGSALFGLGMALKELGRSAEAEECLRRELVISENLEGFDAPSTGESLFNLGNFLITLGRYDEAQKLLQRELLISEKHQEDQPDDYLASLMNLGTMLRDSGKLEEAAAEFQKAIIIGEQLQRGAPFAELAEVYILQNNFDDAINLLCRCLEIRKQNLPVDDESILETKERLAEVYEMAGRLEEAASIRADIANGSVH
jgi:tetratricopeptide (TPR) repeat protein